MGKINVLSKDIANKIAAGEVVERPASVIKELMENSLDSGSSHITVEIKNGGITYMRVTDNGCGMSKEDAKTAFLRHATSKLSNEKDLERISSLGFRGEALSSIAAVSEVELLTCEKGAREGYMVKLKGGAIEDEGIAGCPEGTTIIVRNLFYNTPARAKFLKTDRTEGGYISDIVQRLALSHPEISIKFISDGRIKLQTNGDNKLTSCIYSIYGKDYVKNIKNVSYQEDDIKIEGVAGLPVLSRANRRFQTIFVNSRYVRSNLLTSAAEEAYKNKLMSGKFPFFILNLTISYHKVDVNVHPSKTEVKFADEKAAYHAMYWAVFNALMSDEGNQISKKYAFKTIKSDINEHDNKNKNIIDNKPFAKVSSDTPLQDDKTTAFKFNIKTPNQAREIIRQIHQTLNPNEQESTRLSEDISKLSEGISFDDETSRQPLEIPLDKSGADYADYKIIGQAFETYIMIQKDDSLILIDQHAAHERQIYQRLIKDVNINSQVLLLPVSVFLTDSEFAIISENIEFFNKLGFELEEFGNNSIIIRQTPVDLPEEELKNLVIEIIENINAQKQHIQADAQDRALYTIACKAAIKANKALSDKEMKALIDWVLSQKGVDTCPHGRPLTYRFTKYDIEKLFKRV